MSRDGVSEPTDSRRLTIWDARNGRRQAGIGDVADSRRGDRQGSRTKDVRSEVSGRLRRYRWEAIAWPGEDANPIVHGHGSAAEKGLLEAGRNSQARKLRAKIQEGSPGRG